MKSHLNIALRMRNWRYTHWLSVRCMSLRLHSPCLEPVCSPFTVESYALFYQHSSVPFTDTPFMLAAQNRSDHPGTVLVYYVNCPVPFHSVLLTSEMAPERFWNGFCDSDNKAIPQNCSWDTALKFSILVTEMYIDGGLDWHRDFRIDFYLGLWCHYSHDNNIRRSIMHCLLKPLSLDWSLLIAFLLSKAAAKKLMCVPGCCFGNSSCYCPTWSPGNAFGWPRSSFDKAVWTWSRLVLEWFWICY